MTYELNTGRRLQLVRIARNIRQWDLARESGISQSVLSQIERGYRPVRDRELAALLKALDLSLDDLHQVRA